MLELSVIIPTHQRHAQVQSLLQSLYAQSLQPEKFEILVVSNRRDNVLRQKLSRHLRKPTLLTAEALGVNFARNCGLRAAKGSIVAFFDDDCRLQDGDFLKRILELHWKHPEVIAIGGPYTLPEDSQFFARSYHHIAANWLASSVYDPLGYTINLIGGNVSYKAQALKRTGLIFDESIGFGGAETSLHARLHLAGHKMLYVPDLAVEHVLKAGAWRFANKAFRQGVGFENRILEGVFHNFPGRRSPTEEAAQGWRERQAVKLYRACFDYGRLWARRSAKPDPETDL